MPSTGNFRINNIKLNQAKNMETAPNCNRQSNLNWLAPAVNNNDITKPVTSSKFSNAK